MTAPTKPRLTIEIDLELRRQYKIKTMLEKSDMKKKTIELIKKYLKEPLKK